MIFNFDLLLPQKMTRLLLSISLFLGLVHRIASWGLVDPTKGFLSLPLNQSNLDIQRPYDVPEDERYSFKDGVHKLWVFSSDKPHTPTSRTNPRTEIRISGYDYSSGVWQFEGYGYVPCGTSGVCIMQVFGASPHATTVMLRVYNGSLYYYRNPVLLENIYDKWFKLNVIHDVNASTVKIFIDGQLKMVAPGHGGASHYFKCGVYAQDDASYYMESRWKGIKVHWKMDGKDYGSCGNLVNPGSVTGLPPEGYNFRRPTPAGDNPC